MPVCFLKKYKRNWKRKFQFLYPCAKYAYHRSLTLGQSWLPSLYE